MDIRTSHILSIIAVLGIADLQQIAFMSNISKKADLLESLELLKKAEFIEHKENSFFISSTGLLWLRAKNIENFEEDEAVQVALTILEYLYKHEVDKFNAEDILFQLNIFEITNSTNKAFDMLLKKMYIESTGGTGENKFFFHKVDSRLSFFFS